jgi:hypothetical protein
VRSYCEHSGEQFGNLIKVLRAHYVTEQPSTSKTEGAAIQRKGVPPFLGCFGLLALPTIKARILCLDSL